MSTPESMTFARHGRSYHLKIETAGDLECVLELDEAHWVATGAPIDTLGCDATFLRLVDSDKNGRILCCEMKDAVRWLGEALRDRRGVTDHRTSLRLGALNTEHEDGRNIHEAAGKILDQSGVTGADKVTLEQVRAVKQKVEETPVSEAGVVLPEAAEEAEIRQFIANVLASVGGVEHPSGAEGVNQAKLDRFLAEAEAYLEWQARADIPKGQTLTEIMPLGEDTDSAFEAFSLLRDKVDQFFAQCRAVALDARVAGHIGPDDSELSALDFSDPDVLKNVLKDAPLAGPNPDRTLPLDNGTNPYYAEQLTELRTRTLEPVLGKTSSELTEADWEKVRETFAAHQAWLDEKPGDGVEALGTEKLATCLDGKHRAAVEALIAESADTALVLDNIRLTEKLILYQAYMIPLANNFVSFPDLYDERQRAMFEMGTLICDGRRFNMAVKVRDRARHSAVAGTSNMFVVYAEITSRDGSEKLEVAVPVTSGGKGNLCVGKRGLFLDVDGNEWDAVVVQMIENPISLGEALASPFRRLGRALTGKIESITAQAEKKLNATATAAVTQAPAAAAPARAGGGLMAGGMLMGGGVALAALGSALAYITKTLAGLEWYSVVIGIAGAVLAVLLPISIVAVAKLRRRDLSAILEGSGWAINARMRLTRKQCRFFTQRPEYPRGARGIRRRRWIAVLVAAVIAAVVTLWIIFGGEKGKGATAPAPEPTPDATSTQN